MLPHLVPIILIDCQALHIPLNAKRDRLAKGGLRLSQESEDILTPVSGES